MALKPIRLAVSGASGKMGSRIIALALQEPTHFQLIAAIEHADSPLLGHNAASQTAEITTHLTISATIDVPADVLIDFSAPSGARHALEICRKRKIAMVIGTTGLTADDHRLIDQAAREIPVLQAANTSLGVNLLLQMVGKIARELGDAYDIEILEAHHNQKKDAPSGTALALAQSIATATGRTLESDLVHGRHGHDVPRKPGTIGMHAMRMGDVVGEHTVYFAAAGERIELTHVATTRDTFARGALQAAKFLAAQKPGRYTMADVLGI